MKNKTILKRILLISTLFSASFLHAAPYVTGQVGVFAFDSDLTNHLNKSGRLAIGQLWDVKCLQMGLETGLHYSEQSANPAVDYRLSNWDLLGVMDFYFTEKTDVFFKLGPTLYQEKSQNLGFTTSGVTSKALLGVGYDITKQVNLNISMIHQGETHHTMGDGLAMVGFTYTFDQ